MVTDLDGVWYEAVVNDSHSPGIGYKTVGNGRVYFVNCALSQWLGSPAVVQGVHLPLRVRQTRYHLGNLIALDVPQGEREVALEYGMSWVAWAGVFLSGFFGLLVLLAFVFFRRAGRGIDAAQGWFERWLTEWASGKEGEASS